MSCGQEGCGPDIPRHLDELYDKAVRDGMIPWNDALPARYKLGLPCCSLNPEDHRRCVTLDCDCGCHNPPEYQPDEDYDWDDQPWEGDE